MIEKELKIREVSGDYALDIPFADGSVNTIYFNSKRNAETVKHIIEVDGSKPNEATVCDMQEIKHGSWEYDSEGVGYANYLCSECGNFLTFYEDIDLYPYCPYCGAKMDKERDIDCQQERLRTSTERFHGSGRKWHGFRLRRTTRR